MGTHSLATRGSIWCATYQSVSSNNCCPVFLAFVIETFSSLETAFFAIEARFGVL
ncbi:hypothetical protein MHBO_001164 [Bonamia ostreae]|uniref:Uncharacterized protein n=1 Tax=Bonamia ostreae TaxID=126728 RepID=A0ABV2AHZ7_9EUKA